MVRGHVCTYRQVSSGHTGLHTCCARKGHVSTARHSGKPWTAQCVKKHVCTWRRVCPILTESPGNSGL